MAGAEAVEQQQAAREKTGGRFVRFLGRSPLHILLVVLGLLWLVPTIGLFLTSLLSAEDYLEGGWWQVFSEPSKFTFENYSAIFDNETITSSLVTTIWIAIGGEPCFRSSSGLSPATPSRGSTSPDATGSSSA